MTIPNTQPNVAHPTTGTICREKFNRKKETLDFHKKIILNNKIN
jgi:hypothetical protein